MASIKKDIDLCIDGYKDFVFISNITGKCLNNNNVRRTMRDIEHMNEYREVQLPHISPHILRYTFCCRMAEAGCDIKVLQYLMGNSDIRATLQIYNRIDDGRVQREIRRLEVASADAGKMLNSLIGERKCKL